MEKTMMKRTQVWIILILSASLMFLSGCFLESGTSTVYIPVFTPMEIAEMINEAAENVEKMNYSDALNVLSLALISDPDNPALKSAKASTLAARAGVSTEEFDDDIIRDEDGSVNLVATIYRVSNSINYHNPEVTKFGIKDVENAILTLASDDFDVSSLSTAVKAEIGKLALLQTALATNYLFEGKSPETMTDTEIEIAFTDRYDEVSSSLGMAAHFVEATKFDLAYAVNMNAGDTLKTQAGIELILDLIKGNSLLTLVQTFND